MRARIAGLGQWLPDRVRENDEWPAEFVEASRTRRGDRVLVDIPVGDADECQRIAARYLARESTDPFLGTTRRRIAEPEVSSAEAEARAAEAALADAGVDPQSVDVVLSWAIVPDRISPSNGSRVAHLVGASRAWAMGVDAACGSTITQLTIAAGLIETGRARTVLLTQSHCVTRAIPLMHPASPNVGDAATAVVVSASEEAGLLSMVAHTDGKHYDAVTWCRGRTKDSDPPWWEAGGPAYIGSLAPDAARMLTLNSVRFGVDTVTELTQRARCSISDVDVLASVQPRRWVPSAIAEGLGLEHEKAPQTFDELAHLGAAGVVANLIEARRRGKLGPGALAALYAQGAGFIRAAALVAF
jgi:3-oxoacyl-[acyl-carrier-protein] synthase-3